MSAACKVTHVWAATWLSRLEESEGVVFGVRPVRPSRRMVWVRAEAAQPARHHRRPLRVGACGRGHTCAHHHLAAVLGLHQAPHGCRHRSQPVRGLRQGGEQIPGSCAARDGRQRLRRDVQRSEVQSHQAVVHVGALHGHAAATPHLALPDLRVVRCTSQRAQGARHHPGR
eukprot:1187568-Prorocentrum_minimum.AAC.2